MALTGTGYAVGGIGPKGPFLMHVSLAQEIEHFGHLSAVVRKLEEALGGPVALTIFAAMPAAPLIAAPPAGGLALVKP